MCFLFYSVIRDPDGYIYLRERDGCILAGGFEPVAKPVYEEESKSYYTFPLRKQYISKFGILNTHS